MMLDILYALPGHLTVAPVVASIARLQIQVVPLADAGILLRS